MARKKSTTTTLDHWELVRDVLMLAFVIDQQPKNATDEIRNFAKKLKLQTDNFYQAKRVSLERKLISELRPKLTLLYEDLKSGSLTQAELAKNIAEEFQSVYTVWGHVLKNELPKVVRRIAVTNDERRELGGSSQAADEVIARFFGVSRRAIQKSKPNPNLSPVGPFRFSGPKFNDKEIQKILKMLDLSASDL